MPKYKFSSPSVIVEVVKNQSRSDMILEFWDCVVRQQGKRGGRHAKFCVNAVSGASAARIAVQYYVRDYGAQE